MSSYSLLPVVEVEPGRWSVPDEFLSDCWRRLEQAGRVPEVFWNGEIRTEDEFQALFHRSGIHPVVILRGEEPVLLAWLSPNVPDWASAHFVGLTRYQPAMGVLLMSFWAGSGLIGLTGLIPAANRPACHVVEAFGFRRVGEIPAYCWLAYRGERATGVLYTYHFREED